MPRPNRLEDFWDRVDHSAGPEACWPWIGPLIKGRDIRGACKIHQRFHVAHRVAWQLAHGAIPEGLCVLHRCDNTICCNPSHLFLGTQQDNARDREAKGRGGKRGHPPGERHPNAKLTNAQAEEIRSLLAQGKLSQHSIAKRYGVSQTLISHILHGKTRKQRCQT